MNIEPHNIPVRDVVKNYVDSNIGGVSGYNGQLDIRPPYQREFVYKEQQRQAVIDTILRGFPLNVFYWAENRDPQAADPDATDANGLRTSSKFEILDGQQRTISICQYVAGDFSVPIDGRPMAFHNLTKDVQDSILDYQLMTYICEGDDQSKLGWFKTINIAGERLTDQELRNAVYTGTWLTHAKSIFSKPGGAAVGLAGKYLKGAPIRQEFLETAIAWKAGGPKHIDQYMSDHQHDPTANELWTYFQNVIWWAQQTFTTYRKEMKGLPWGPLYDAHGQENLDPAALERRISELIRDPDVTNHKGIYSYVLDGNVNHLSIRDFDNRQRAAAYERQEGLCANGDRCLTPGNDDGTQVFQLSDMHADHITPWSKGGKTVDENCQMLCAPCNRKKSNV
ncbi:DUF262 domain-containing protein [Corynebacterium xerosis]|uniref:HNH endonuclease family protein n=1 Tax=Corynebacterium xerosis TaxID=1725 RepID=UPI000EB3D23E|nr:DUF262 domain-containing protein [Corynebacterium xerosis]AYJ33017.1 DUF262 domain-containing protein [Corynebacterium xerosis]